MVRGARWKIGASMAGTISWASVMCSVEWWRAMLSAR